MSLVAGVDSSTQSTKVVLRHIASGEVIARSRASHPTTNPPVSEQDPSGWRAALAAALEQLEPHRGQISAISVAGQQHGLVTLDDNDEPVRPAKLWNDTTSATQASRLVADDPTFWANRCGSVPLAAFTITKLAWLIEHEPEAAKRVRRVMLPHDYLTWALTGRHVTDRGDASGTGWFDPVANQYRLDLLERAVDDPDRWLETLPAVLPVGDSAGQLTDAASAEFGLKPGIPVGGGTGDNMAAALGLGLEPGDVAISLGTSGTVYATSRASTHDPTGSIAGFADAAGDFLPLICTMNATKVTDTVAAWLGVTQEQLAALALEACDSSRSRPTLLPYFDGERQPSLPQSSGVWHGLRTDTERCDIALSAFDGVLCGLLEGFDALDRVGIDVRGTVNLIGGGAKSTGYRQRAADLLGREIHVPNTQELVAAGAAAQAAALVTGELARDVARRWLREDAVVVSPSSGDGAAVRERHRQERNALIDSYQRL